MVCRSGLSLKGSSDLARFVPSGESFWRDLGMNEENLRMKEFRIVHLV